MKRAVCAIILNKDNEILIVSRKNNHSSFGLIGGKVDEGETYVEALIREIKEECGLNLKHGLILFEDRESSYDVMTFLCICHSGRIYSEENAVLKWIKLNELNILYEGNFGEYNRKLFNSFELEKLKEYQTNII